MRLSQYNKLYDIRSVICQLGYETQCMKVSRAMPSDIEEGDIEMRHGDMQPEVQSGIDCGLEKN